jgi:hypothetical protein
MLPEFKYSMILGSVMLKRAPSLKAGTTMESCGGIE